MLYIHLFDVLNFFHQKFIIVCLNNSTLYLYNFRNESTKRSIFLYMRAQVIDCNQNVTVKVTLFFKLMETHCFITLRNF